VASYSFADLEQAWITAGGDPSKANIAAAIAMAESGGNPRSGELNNNPATGDYSVGPWQVNYFGSLGGPRTSQFGPSSLLESNLVADARAAVAISNNGQDFTPWTTYTHGTYEQYLTSSGSSVLGVAQSWVGTPYGSAAVAVKGFVADCSSFVQAVFGQVGVALPRTTYQQVTTGSPVASLADALPGDLIFFQPPGEAPNSHVGIYAGNGMMYDAPTFGGTVGLHSIQGYGPITAIRREAGTVTANLASDVTSQTPVTSQQATTASFWTFVFPFLKGGALNPSKGGSAVLPEFQPTFLTSLATRLGLLAAGVILLIIGLKSLGSSSPDITITAPTSRGGGGANLGKVKA